MSQVNLHPEHIKRVDKFPNYFSLQKAPIAWSCKPGESSYGIFVNEDRVLIGSEDGTGEIYLRLIDTYATKI